MDLIVYEYDQDYVLECFRHGEFDFVDGVSEVAETEFLLTLSAEASKKILEKIRRLRRDLEQELKLVRAP